LSFEVAQGCWLVTYFVFLDQGILTEPVLPARLMSRLACLDPGGRFISANPHSIHIVVTEFIDEVVALAHLLRPFATSASEYGVSWLLGLYMN